VSVTVVLVDDHPVVRSGLRAMLASAPDLAVVGEAAGGDEAVALAATLHPDVVLCDMRLGDGPDGVQTTRALRRLERPPAVLILTTYAADRDLVGAVEAGAAGYLMKDAAPDAIVSATRDAAAGRSVWAPEMAQRVVLAVRQDGPSLTGREVEVLGLVAGGASNADIARELFLSSATVKSHLSHIFVKLGADSRTQAVAKARERGLLG